MTCENYGCLKQHKLHHYHIFDACIVFYVKSVLCFSWQVSWMHNEIESSSRLTEPWRAHLSNLHEASIWYANVWLWLGIYLQYEDFNKTTQKASHTELTTSCSNKQPDLYSARYYCRCHLDMTTSAAMQRTLCDPHTEPNPLTFQCLFS